MIVLPVRCVYRRLDESRNTLLYGLLIDLSARDLSRRILMSIGVRCFNVA